MKSITRATARDRSDLHQSCIKWSSYLHVVATLSLLLALVVATATKDDALRPRHRLREEALGCVHITNAPSVEGLNWSKSATLSDMNLRSDLATHSGWLRKVDLPRTTTVYHTIRVAWVADSMTDTVRVFASDRFVGLTMSFAMSSRSPWWGHAKAWTDVAGNERDLGTIRVDRRSCLSSTSTR